MKLGYICTLSFASCNLPEYLLVGYHRVPIRPYVPLPIRYNNCFKFGHIATYCKGEKKCPNCANDFHLTENDPTTKCENDKKCINCFNDHDSLSRNCKIYLKEKEIQRI